MYILSDKKYSELIDKVGEFNNMVDCKKADGMLTILKELKEFNVLSRTDKSYEVMNKKAVLLTDSLVNIGEFENGFIEGVKVGWIDCYKWFFKELKRAENE